MDTNYHDPTNDTVEPDYAGHSVVDEHDHEIGKVVDVVYDDATSGAGATTETPSWLVVDPGMLRAAHWVPVTGTHRSASGGIVVPWDRDLIKHSPKATDDHRMTPALARQLTEHYELASSE